MFGLGGLLVIMRDMFTLRFVARLVACACVSAMLLGAQPALAKKHLFIRLGLGSEVHAPVSGRLLVFVAPGSGAKEVDASPFAPSEVYVAAKEVRGWSAGTTVDLDADDLAYPTPLSEAKPGDYQLQAVLDVAHNYNYSGRSPGDIVSEVVPLSAWNPGQGIEQIVVLSRVLPETALANKDESIHEFSFLSRSLTQFWGRETSMRGLVVTPPSYKPQTQRKFPTVYYTHGFGGQLKYLYSVGEGILKRMKDRAMPEMIWVMLDESSPTGTHEFADSVNNGPWGKALTAELIPYLESTYRMDGVAKGRFLQGHSSGGWATLWLQTRYPKLFGGTWSTSPDSSDFHDFTGPDLYGKNANLYRKADGSPYFLVRDKGKELATLEQFAKLEQTLGSYGGQFASFEWVFSPRGADGRPVPMFNRETGDVDPAVVAYWRDHYDIANLVTKQWKTIGPDLRGKIHLIVGTADTFHLDGPARRLQSVLEPLKADAHFTFIPDRSHFDLYKIGDDQEGLMNQIAKEMYKVARPGRK
jgi:pimeloyl-ACP methyl ester carboxylesterase